MPAFQWYPKAPLALAAGHLDWPNESGMKVALMGSGFTFDDAHDTWSDISSSEYAGSGYTAGGLAIANKTLTYVDSSSLTARANSTAYAVGQLRRTATDSGRVWFCVTDGTSDSSEPAAMSSSVTTGRVTDGTVVWANMGSGYVSFDGDEVEFTGLDGTPTPAAVIYNNDGASEHLMGYGAFSSSQEPDSLKVTPPDSGYLAWFGGGVVT